MKAMLGKLTKILSGPNILFYALPWLMVLVTWGSIAQKDMGLYAAQKMFFSSWIFFWGSIPMPGGILTIGLISINLLFKFLFKSEWSIEKAGINITHLGILILLLGGLLTMTTMKEGYMIIPEGHETAYVYEYDEAKQEVMIYNDPLFTLPFSIRLDTFNAHMHPATNIASAYQSDVMITQGSTQWPARIEMNKPLRFKGYTVFQSAFDEREGVNVTILSVVWNAGRLFPYISTLIIALGLMLHIGIRLKTTGRRI